MFRRLLRLRKPAVRFRLTCAGWVFVVISLLVGIAAFRSQAPLAHVMFGSTLGALLISLVISRQILSVVVLRRDIPERAWQNQTIYFGYFLQNTHRRGSCLGLEITELAPEGIDSVAGYCVHLQPQAIFRAGTRFVARRRGRIRLKNVRLKTRFPFGLIVARRDIEKETSLVVWPARGRMRRQLLHQGATTAASAVPTQSMGGQDEFFGLREYRPGDNPRWIHWRRSAGRSTPVVREMSRPLPEILWVILDTYLDEEPSQSAEQTREMFIRFAGTLIDYAFTRGYKVGLAVAYSEKIALYEPAAGQGQRKELMDALADIDLNTKHQIGEVIGRLSRRSLSQGQVLLATPDRKRLDRVNLAPLRAACGHFRAVFKEEILRVFDDNPLSTAREEP